MPPFTFARAVGGRLAGPADDVGMFHQRHHRVTRSKRKRRDYCDCSGLDCGACDCVPCDLSFTLLGVIASAVPGRAPRARVTAPARAGMVAIRGYQRWLSPRLPIRCRHVPHCSAYGMTAVGRYGLVAGSRLTAARIRRCNRTTPHGTVDPVP
jgi:putative membrane protein insertion efficiency factor